MIRSNVRLASLGILLVIAACQKGTEAPKAGSSAASASGSASASASGVGGGGGGAVAASGGGSASASASGGGAAVASGDGDGSAVAAGGGGASGTAPAADGGPSCKDVIEHEAAVMLAGPGVDDQTKQMIASQKDQAVQQCNQNPPPVEIRKCFMAANSTDAFESCVQDYAKAHKPPPPAGIHLPTADDLADLHQGHQGLRAR